jgi:hypothetical protein
MHKLGDYERSCVLNKDNLNRRRLVLGADHPATLASATNLAYDFYELGEYEQAYILNQDSLARRRDGRQNNALGWLRDDNLSAQLDELGDGLEPWE